MHSLLWLKYFGMHLFLWVCVGLSWVFLYAFSGLNVKLGAYCKAWMPGIQVNVFQGREADKSSLAVRGSKEERQTILILKWCIMRKIVIIWSTRCRFAFTWKVVFCTGVGCRGLAFAIFDLAESYKAVWRIPPFRRSYALKSQVDRTLRQAGELVVLKLHMFNIWVPSHYTLCNCAGRVTLLYKCIAIV